MLKGWRTYLAIGLGVIVAGLSSLGYIDSKTADILVAIFGGFGIYFRYKA